MRYRPLPSPEPGFMLFNEDKFPTVVVLCEERESFREALATCIRHKQSCRWGSDRCPTQKIVGKTTGVDIYGDIPDCFIRVNLKEAKDLYDKIPM